MELAVDQASGAYRHPASWAREFAPLSLSDMLEGSAAKTPRASLIDFYGRKFSYADVVQGTRCVATGLAAAGIRPGDRVGLYLPNVPQYVAAYFGVLRLGAVVVNFSSRSSTEDLRHQARDSGVRLLFTLSVGVMLRRVLELLDTSPVERLVVGSIADDLPIGRAAYYRLFQRSEVMKPPADPRIVSYRRFIENDGSVPKIGVDPMTDLALLQYSGGTTGAPKGAMLTHQALTANARQINAVDPCSREFGRNEPDRIIGALPLYHIFAHACVLHRTVSNGGEIVMLPRFEAPDVIAAIQRTRATSLPGVPTMYQELLDSPNLRNADLSSLRYCISGGAPLSIQLKERFERRTGARLVEGYGLTEGGVLCVNPIEGANKAGTIGQPLAQTRMALVDRTDPDRDSMPGEAGEIIVHGPQIMTGYWRDQEPPPFVERKGRRWLRTGDVGTIDADGYVRIVDRLKDMITVGGFKVFPSQVEAVLCRHPVVREALVIGVPDHHFGELPKAFVTLVSDAGSTGEELKTWANPHLGKHEQLSSVEVRQSLPYTMVGKPDRRAMIAREEAHTRLSVPGGA